jgi:uncharacterized protein YkwD
MIAKRFQTLIALAAAFAISVPLSVSAETRTRSRTDLEQLAADLERAFGRGSVSVERHRPAPGAPRSYVDSVVAAMNRERAAHGLGPLRLEPRLTAAAGDRVDDMLAKRYFAHVSPDGIQPFTWVRANGYRYRIVGENLALGYRSGQATVAGWMGSPGHRENILQRGFNEVGIAVAESSPSRGDRGPLVVALYASR